MIDCSFHFSLSGEFVEMEATCLTALGPRSALPPALALDGQAPVHKRVYWVARMTSH